ncbi:MAG: FAD-dependent monooxygenase [Tabrizicola sp.]
MEFNTDVLIAGAGPAGLALAIDLTRRGIATRIIERNAAGFPGSRAKGLQPRTLEVLEDLGALAPVLAEGSSYPKLGIHLGPITIPKRMITPASPDPGTPYRETWLLPQFRTDAILLARLQDLGGRVEFGCELMGFAQDAEGVTATVGQAGGETRIRARYLVGADGGASGVRKGLGIAFEGKTDAEDRMIILDCRIEGLSRDRWHIWPWWGGRFAGACPLPGGDLFQVMIRLQKGEEPDLADEALNLRFQKQTGTRLRLTQIQWKSIFRPNIRLASQYRQGRGILIGDAAHVHTPMGGQGLNTGVQDANNLGWKLGQVLAGAPEALLNTYEAERRPIAARVLGLSTEKYEALDKFGAAALKRGEDERQLSISYALGPLAGEGQSPVSALAAGDRAPDALLAKGELGEARLFDLLAGPDFALVAYGSAAIQAMGVLAWPNRGAGLRRIAVAGEGELAGEFRDHLGQLSQGYGLTESALILIRPDGHIGRIARASEVAAIAEYSARVAP